MKHYIRSYWTKYKQLYKKGLKGIAAFLAIGAIIVFVLATIASRGIGVIFNEVMARQTMMRGTVTVESLSATPWGTLTLQALFGRTQKGMSCSMHQVGKSASICGMW